MLLYHGSSKPETPTLKKNQASTDGKVPVPEGELLDAVYLTPNLEFAIAVAAMPEGGADIDDEKRTIEFEKPELFDPKREIFVYEIDTNKIPEENLRQIDEKQYAVVGIDEIKPDNVRRFKGEEVLKYYDLINWENERREANREIRFR